MSYFFVFLLLVSTPQPVIELDDLVVEGEMRQPTLIELRESRLSEELNSLSAQSLKALEERLLQPGVKKQTSAAGKNP